MVRVDQAFIKRITNAGLIVRTDPPALLEFAHENRPFDPQGPYAELLHFPNDITPFSLSRTNETDGVFRVILRWPASEGAIEAKRLAEEILDLFPIGQKVCHEGVCATVTRLKREPGAQRRQGDVSNDGWYPTVITISYRAFVPR